MKYKMPNWLITTLIIIGIFGAIFTASYFAVLYMFNKMHETLNSPSFNMQIDKMDENNPPK